MLDFRFKSKYSLESHKHVHMAKKFQCALCGNTFSRKAPLIRHMEIHNGTITKRVQCDLCDKTFRCSYNMQNHRRIHTGTELIHNFLYSSLEDYKLLLFILTHTGEKPYRCETCNYATCHQSEFKKHMKRISHLNKLKELSDLRE